MQSSRKTSYAVVDQQVNNDEYSPITWKCWHHQDAVVALIIPTINISELRQQVLLMYSKTACRRNLVRAVNTDDIKSSFSHRCSLYREHNQNKWLKTFSENVSTRTLTRTKSTRVSAKSGSKQQLIRFPDTFNALVQMSDALGHMDTLFCRTIRIPIILWHAHSDASQLNAKPRN